MGGNIFGDIMKIAQLAVDVCSGNWVAAAEDIFKDIAQLTGNKTLEEIAAMLPPVGLLESPMMSGLMGNMGLQSFTQMNSSISGALGMSTPSLTSALNFGTNSSLQALQFGAQSTSYLGQLTGNQSLAGIGSLGNLAVSNPLVQQSFLSGQLGTAVNNRLDALAANDDDYDGTGDAAQFEATKLLNNQTDAIAQANPNYDGSTDSTQWTLQQYVAGKLSPQDAQTVAGAIAVNNMAGVPLNAQQLLTYNSALNAGGDEGNAAMEVALGNAGKLTPQAQQWLQNQAIGAGVTGNQLQSLQSAMGPANNGILTQGILGGAFNTSLSPQQLQILQAAAGSGNFAPVYSAASAGGLPPYLQNAPSWQQTGYQVGMVLGAYGQSMPGLQARLPIMTNQASLIGSGLASYGSSPTYANPYATPTLVAGQGMSSGGGYITPSVSNYAPSITPQYGGTNSVLNQGIANGAFSTALTSDQQNMLSQAQAAGASGPQLAMMQLQMQMENQQEVLQAIGKIFQMLDQTAKALINDF